MIVPWTPPIQWVCLRPYEVPSVLGGWRCNSASTGWQRWLRQGSSRQPRLACWTWNREIQLQYLVTNRRHYWEEQVKLRLTTTSRAALKSLSAAARPVKRLHVETKKCGLTADIDCVFSLAALFSSEQYLLKGNSYSYKPISTLFSPQFMLLGRLPLKKKT